MSEVTRDISPSQAIVKAVCNEVVIIELLHVIRDIFLGYVRAKYHTDDN